MYNDKRIHATIFLHAIRCFTDNRQIWILRSIVYDRLLEILPITSSRKSNTTETTIDRDHLDVPAGTAHDLDIDSTRTQSGSSNHDTRNPYQFADVIRLYIECKYHAVLFYMPSMYLPSNREVEWRWHLIWVSLGSQVHWQFAHRWAVDTRYVWHILLQRFQTMQKKKKKKHV